MAEDYGTVKTLDDLDTTKPDGSTEAPSILDNAIKAFKLALLNSLSWKVTYKTNGTYTPTLAEGGVWFADASGGNVQFNIESITDNYAGKELIFVKVSSANSLIINPGAKTINGSTTDITVTKVYSSVVLRYNGTNYERINHVFDTPTLLKALIDDGDAGCTLTSANQTHATPIATIPDFTGAADVFVMLALAQTLTNKTLTASVLGSAIGAGTPNANAMYTDNQVNGWISFNGGTQAILDSYNISGAVTQNAAGDYTITWDRDFADANYSISGMGTTTAGNPVNVSIHSTATKLKGSVRINTANHTGVLVDPDQVCIMAVGKH